MSIRNDSKKKTKEEKKAFVKQYNDTFTEALHATKSIVGAERFQKFDSIMGYDENAVKVLSIKAQEFGAALPILKADDGETMFMARQQEFFDVNQYMVDYPDDFIQKHIPTSSEVPAGAKMYTYRLTDEYSRWNLASKRSNDGPRSNASRSEVHFPVVEVQGSFEYTYDEIQESMYAGVPLSMLKAEACKRGYEQEVNRYGWYGNYKEGVAGTDPISGLLFDDEINHVAAANGAWFDVNGLPILTPAQMYQDMVTLATYAKLNTFGLYSPTKILMPLRHEAYIKNTAYVLGSTTLAVTIYAFFKQNYPEIEIVGTSYLAADAFVEFGRDLNPRTGSASAVNCMVAMPNDASKFKFVLGPGYNQLPVQMHGYSFVFNANAYISSIVKVRPKSIVCVSGC